MQYSISPDLEPVPTELFTNRDQILGYIRGKWLDSVKRFIGPSLAIIGPRRVGKTAILMKIHEELFEEQGNVIPFVFAVPEIGATWHEISEQFYQHFFRQYVAFKCNKPELMSDIIEMSEIEPYLNDLDIEFQKAYQRFLKHREVSNDSLFWNAAIHTPHYVAKMTQQPIIVMIDEFQWLNERIFLDEEHTRRLGARLTSSFQRLSEARYAPMIVAGSVVTLMTTRVFTGGLVGRFSKINIGHLAHEDGVELVLRYARYYGMELPIESAELISKLTNGHPYYITQLFISRMPNADLTTPEGVEKVYDYEIRQGRIRGFWNEHFQINMEQLNDRKDVKRVIFYMLDWESKLSDEERSNLNVNIRGKKIAQALNMDLERTREILKLISELDIIQRSTYDAYRGFSDDTLARCLRLEFEAEIREVDDEVIGAEIVAELREKIASLEAQLKKESDRYMGKLRNLIGKVGEMMAERIMRAFKNQEVDGQLFSVDDKVFLPRFEKVYPTQVQIAGTRGHQIDNFGIPVDASHPHWITEQKNQEEPISPTSIEKFIQAASQLKKDKNLSSVVMWFYAKGGFSNNARELATQHNILLSDYEQLCQLTDIVGVV
ncbi:hypothetical protein H8E77_32005 [bacterium]|nr:hypothetical protein [bacterium]